MAWPTIEIILLYNETNSCLSSTIEKVVYSAKVYQKLVSKVGLKKVVYLAWVREKLV